MDSILVRGGRRLNGAIPISGRAGRAADSSPSGNRSWSAVEARRILFGGLLQMTGRGAYHGDSALPERRAAVVRR